MKRNFLKPAMLAAVGVPSALVLGACGAYATRLHTLSTLRQHTHYADGYNLYSIKVKYDYNLNDVLNKDIKDNDTFMRAIVNKSAPHAPFRIEAPDFACSAFTLSSCGCAGHADKCAGLAKETNEVTSDVAPENAPDECASEECAPNSFVFMGRNYDFKFDTSALVVECNPKDGYKSIGLAALNNVHANTPMRKYKKRIACLGAPFICLDGVNEKGVSIAVLTLDSEPVNQVSHKRKITTSLAIRLVLDRAATTQDAVQLLGSYDMFATSGRDYHFYITDAKGCGCVVEWDPEDPERKMKAVPMRSITNFYALYKDRVLPNQKNGIYGHGKERYEAIERVLGEQGAQHAGGGLSNSGNQRNLGNQGDPSSSSNQGNSSSSNNSSNSNNLSNSSSLNSKDAQNVAWRALQASAQDPNPEDVTSNTQYSAVYDNLNGSMSVSLRRNWGDVFEFSL